ncbi:type II toxin-antitoxin system prevent-host-death family antitoxin [Micromonospora sp. NPDC020750]|uniref:type II toxin-antitoxin system prevent-host-death family antitoxin n=1 Tax=unclassified Micromonospora TaxID=2617518 RepID=UPI00379B514F
MKYPRPLGMTEGTAVYRFYSEPGVLVYVGITSVPEIRFRQHALYSTWWNLADQSLTEVVWRETRGLAEAEEVCAIIVERPLCNIKDKPGRVFPKPPPPPAEVMGVRAMPLTDVRRRLREVVDDAAAGRPTVVLKHGEPRAVFVSEEFLDLLVSELGSGILKNAELIAT